MNFACFWLNNYDFLSSYVHEDCPTLCVQNIRSTNGWNLLNLNECIIRTWFWIDIFFFVTMTWFVFKLEREHWLMWEQYVNSNKEVNHDLLCMNICCAPKGGVETRAWKARAPPKGPSRCKSENHVWLLLLHKSILSLENVGESTSKVLRKVIFPVPIMVQLRTFLKRRFQGKW